MDWIRSGLGGGFAERISLHIDCGGRALWNPSADIGPPQAKRKIHTDYDHEQRQDRVPLSADSFEFGPDCFGPYEDDEDQKENYQKQSADGHRNSVSLVSKNG